MNPLLQELEWRGMIQDVMPGTSELLDKEMVTGYVGFDPTADSLHIGSLVPILLMVHFQRAGHKPIALLGGATGMVGDPSGKSAERNMLDEETLSRNLDGIRSQLEKFIDFNSSAGNAAEIINNHDWFREMGFLRFLREAGKFITVNYMMAKDSVKKRLEGDSGISFTEFSYQLIQGYDFYWLYKNRNCKIQFGGSDQWGNMVTGTELIRRKEGGEAFAFTCPLVKKADGGKFGKTEQGNIWLNPERTTPYQFYQFWLNASDEDAASWIRVFTFLGRGEIESLELEHQRDPSQRVLQKKLAEEITRYVHNAEELEKAIETTRKLFGNKGAEAGELSVDDLQAIEGIKRSSYSRSRIEGGTDLIEFLTDNGIFKSRGEARKMLQNGGVSLNRNRVSDPQMMLGKNELLHGKYVLVQVGKKNYYLVEAE